MGAPWQERLLGVCSGLWHNAHHGNGSQHDIYLTEKTTLLVVLSHRSPERTSTTHHPHHQHYQHNNDGKKGVLGGGQGGLRAKSGGGEDQLARLAVGGGRHQGGGETDAGRCRHTQGVVWKDANEREHSENELLFFHNLGGVSTLSSRASLLLLLNASFSPCPRPV